MFSFFRKKDAPKEIPPGLLSYRQHLSIWEVSCRWAGYDPKSIRSSNVPTPVSDILGLILQAQINSQLPVTKSDGVSVRDWSWLDDWKAYVPPREEFDGTEGHRFQLYQEFMRDITSEHRELTEHHYDMIETRKYRSEVLKSIHVYRDDLFFYCKTYGIDPPSFWFDPKTVQNEFRLWLEDIDNDEESSNFEADEAQPSNVGKLTREQIDRTWQRLTHAQKTRLLCRQVASIMWKEDKTRTIQSIINDDIIQYYCDAARYGDPKTIREWIADLDPRPPESKKGRARS